MPKRLGVCMSKNIMSPSLKDTLWNSSMVETDMEYSHDTICETLFDKTPYYEPYDLTSIQITITRGY